MDEQIASEAKLLQQALIIVERDLDPVIEAEYDFQIVRASDSGLLFVGLKDGRYWSGGTSLSAHTASDAIHSVAVGLQDCIMEVIGRVWPECPLHGYGLHLRVRNDDSVWSCEGAEPHIVAAVGSLTT